MIRTLDRTPGVVRAGAFACIVLTAGCASQGSGGNIVAPTATAANMARVGLLTEFSTLRAMPLHKLAQVFAQRFNDLRGNAPKA